MSSEARRLVSVVIPMLNERDAIELCLEAFSQQTYGTSNLEVLVVDGGSVDGAREIVDRWASEHQWVRVVDNPRTKAAAAFNLGVEHATGEIVVIFSAHGLPHETFVERAVEVLLETGVDGVGGRYEHIGTTPASSAIGMAMVSPFGMASPHRFATERQEVDTISHPAYRIEALRKVGRFDETLERNSDYELNHRMREMGMVLLFDPTVESIYRPRPSLRALGRQFWWYGRWKERVVRRHPGSLRARHLVPPVAVGALAFAPLAMLQGRRGRQVVGLAGLAYGLVVLEAVRRARPWTRGASTAVFAAALPTMHVSWGAGFIASVVEDALGDRR